MGAEGREVGGGRVGCREAIEELESTGLTQGRWGFMAAVDKLDKTGTHSTPKCRTCKL